MVQFHFNFFGHAAGKQPKMSQVLKYAKTHPNLVNTQNKHIIHHFWRMLALKSGFCFFCFGIWSPIFWHLKTIAFDTKVPKRDALLSIGRQKLGFMETEDQLKT